ncbi:DUF6263 family protein [Schlesneria sp. DSM 10557]|uniref:DUF6263 family protein n=1 Tax=Schlesneria sp. DSM 10557 TaxID=3044399 RepID=UPI0035A12568
MLRTLVLSTLTAVLSASLACAEEVNLKLKFEEGSKSVVHRDTKATQTLTLAGMDVDTTSTSFAISRSSIGQRETDGTLKVEEKLESLQSEVIFPGGSVQFDSANPDKKAAIPQLESLMEIFRAAFRLSVSVELDADNKVKSVKLPEGEYDKLSEEAKSHFSPESLQKTFERAFEFLPSEAVKKGDTWERSSETNLGAGQVMSFRTKYEYEGTVEQGGETLDKITGKVFDVNYSINGNPMLQVTQSDLKVTSSESTHLFNRKLGQAVSHTSKTHIVGPLTLVINGTTLPGKVDLTMEEKSERK